MSSSASDTVATFTLTHQPARSRRLDRQHLEGHLPYLLGWIRGWAGAAVDFRGESACTAAPPGHCCRRGVPSRPFLVDGNMVETELGSRKQALTQPREATV